MLPSDGEELKSAGHALGQFVGDWWEKQVLHPLLMSVAAELGLFLDSRSVERNCRGGKILWRDADDNSVDYDFVLEFEGSTSKLGTPVAFLESFWRRGARHSKDKARDDTNKLLPMRDTYPTARFLAIAACGEFTPPARGYVTSRNVELLFVPKSHVVKAFNDVGLVIDYADSATEAQKSQLVKNLYASQNEQKLSDAADAIIRNTGQAAFEAFKMKIHSALLALPQEIRITEAKYSDVTVFESVEEASEFLDARKFIYSDKESSYRYEITYSDGYEFIRSELSWEKLRILHDSLLEFVAFIKGKV